MKRTVVITGASSGIGAQTAAALAARGWVVAVVGRNRERTAAVAASVGGTPFYADYDRLDEVRQLSDDLLSRYSSIKVLLNNAGGLVPSRGVSADGHERTFQHNHLAPFLLTNLLLDRLKSSAARVISTSSIAHRFGSVRLDDLDWENRPWLGGWHAYATAKLETVLFALELGRRSEVESYSVHPGYVSTRFGSNSRAVKLSEAVRPGGFGVPASAGAVPLIRLATDEGLSVENGTYFDRLHANGRSTKQAFDAELATNLWTRSAEIVGLKSEALR